LKHGKMVFLQQTFHSLSVAVSMNSIKLVCVVGALIVLGGIARCNTPSQNEPRRAPQALTQSAAGSKVDRLVTTQTRMTVAHELERQKEVNWDSQLAPNQTLPTAAIPGFDSSTRQSSAASEHEQWNTPIGQPAPEVQGQGWVFGDATSIDKLRYRTPSGDYLQVAKCSPDQREKGQLYENIKNSIERRAGSRTPGIIQREHVTP